MRFGIIFAMKEELKEFVKYLNITNEYKIFDLDFYEGTIGKNRCILVECGVGKVNAARCTQILIDNMKLDYIINIGVAGSVSNKVDIGDIVIGEKLVQHDFDITPFNYEKGYVPGVGVYVKADEYLLLKARENFTLNGCNLKIGTIASGDIFVSERKMSEKINKKFDALCTEMEGASIAQVCYLCHIPFLVIRCISDSPNGNNVLTYEKILEDSSRNVATFLKDILLNF